MRFLKEASKRFKEIGAISPCSRDAVRMCLDHVNLKTSKVIVELGCGDGVFTRHIQRDMTDNQVFFGMEINHELIRLARKNAPGSTIYHDSAENIKTYLKKHNATKADCIISTLPWALFSPAYQRRLLQVIDENLSDGGEFITIAYTLGIHTKKGKSLRRLLSRHFTVQKTPTVWKNLPPAIFYHCSKPREN
ncbi:MAG: class I SAM-dependent methyltransferase [Nanobdellota archaeon]